MCWCEANRARQTTLPAFLLVSSFFMLCIVLFAVRCIKVLTNMWNDFKKIIISWTRCGFNLKWSVPVGQCQFERGERNNETHDLSSYDCERWLRYLKSFKDMMKLNKSWKKKEPKKEIKRRFNWCPLKQKEVAYESD